MDNIINTINDGERVTSSYAEIYFDDNYCDNKKISDAESKLKAKTCDNTDDVAIANEWVSPSDLLIDIIELKPPFTSKITRGITHEGILAIGEEVLSRERAKFTEYLNTLIHENDAAWIHISEHEKSGIAKNVHNVYDKIFKDKSEIMTKEINIFYENSLKELESNLKSEVEKVLISTHAHFVSELNTEIKIKLKKEKKILEGVLKKRYDSEVSKLKKYYRLLLHNELLKNNELINKAIIDRNDALKAFYRQIDAQNISSTMYIMCLERKKCRIKQFILENYQSLELQDKLQKMKDRQDVLNSFKTKEVHISTINKEWEEKIRKILLLFLKFISFSLKLLPEQTSFLLEFEKMVVLQLNELQKMPHKTTSSPILIDEEKLKNTFHFDQLDLAKDECTKEPFVIEGDLLPTPPIPYGSRETLPDDVELPTVRLARQFVYAKCHGYEDIKVLLEAERCKCSDIPSPKPEQQQSEVIIQDSKVTLNKASIESIESESSYEPMFLNDIHRLKECPMRNCNWSTQATFPYLDTYLDFDDEKYNRVLAILGNLPTKGEMASFVDPKDILHKELPFMRTKESHHTVATQYSSQEDISAFAMKCTCADDYLGQGSSHRVTESQSKTLLDNMTKRKISLRRLLKENPNLMKVFTNECFDFQY